MGNCIICGTSTDGPICDIHQEDVVFEFTGDSPAQLTPGRFYQGTVDGYAEFGVFINIGNVTGLLHRSKLDRRLESLDWEIGDEVFVQVEQIRDNGDIDLNWSIRQSEREFRGKLVQTPAGDSLPDETAEPAEEPQTEPPTATDVQPPSQPAPSEPSTPSPEPEPTPAQQTVDEPDRVPVETLSEHIGESVQLEGRIRSVRQTGGPTIFELEDETGVVECAAFEEAGVRAYPDITPDDIVRFVGEVRSRMGDIQVETETLETLPEDDQRNVVRRLETAIEEEARPPSVELLCEDPVLNAVTGDIANVATVIRRAILEERPVVIRHDATVDGYLSGAAIERAVLPLIDDQHTNADAAYIYFDRRPLEDGVYGMNDATNDVTRMLDDRDRHDEKLPLFVFAAAGSTTASLDGLELLRLYEAPCVVIDGRPADAEILDRCTDAVSVTGRTAATVAAAVAASVNDAVRADLQHLPAVSYWENVPAVYSDVATDAGFDETAIQELREAIALEAYYQSYEDKRELIIDLLFEERSGLATQVADQFRRKLDAEVETALENIETETIDGLTISVLDTDAYTHRFDFPSTRLLLDELDRRLDSEAVVGIGSDELEIRALVSVDMTALANALQSKVPEASVVDPGARQPKLEFLKGERENVLAVVAETVADIIAPQPLT